MQLFINVFVCVCVYDSHSVAQHESEAERDAVQAESVAEAGTVAPTESAGSTAYALFVFANKFNNENNATKNSLYANKGLGPGCPDGADRGKSQQQQ